MNHIQHYSLKDRNTLKIDVSCSHFYEVFSEDDIREAFKDIKKQNLTYMILGEGANVLFTHDFEGAIVSLGMKDIEMVAETPEYAEYLVDAGLNWHELVTFTVDKNLGGIENMALIPGLVGAAPIGNIAAYGQNFSDVCEGVYVYDIENDEFKTFTKEECGFTYRESVFKHEYKNKYVIVKVTVRVTKHPTVNDEYWSKKHGSVGDMLAKIAQEPYSIKDIYNAIIALRTEKFPNLQTNGTAGSFFKNPLVTKDQLRDIQKLVPNIQFYPVTDLHYIPNTDETVDDFVKIAAGEVLDTGMHLKGHWEGNVGLYEKHSLVLVTNGKATGEEVDAFAQKIEKAFYDFCGVKLEREVLTIS